MTGFLSVAIIAASIFCVESCQTGKCPSTKSGCINETIDCAVKYIQGEGNNWKKDFNGSCDGDQCESTNGQFYITTHMVIKCAYAIFTDQKLSEDVQKDIDDLQEAIPGVDVENVVFQNLSFNGSVEKFSIPSPVGKSRINFYPPANAASASVAVIDFNKTDSLDTPIKAEVQEEKHDPNTFHFFGVNTSIFVVTVLGTDGSKLSQAVKFDMDTSNDNTKYNLNPDWKVKYFTISCTYLNEDKKWDPSVCETVSTGPGVTQCKCRHNSAFALVFAAKFIEPLPSGITTLSIVLEIISVLFFAITIIMLGVYRKKIRNFDRTIVQINLCTALLLMHVFFVVGPSLTKNGTGCVAVSALSHLFLLSSAILMVMEGMLMLVKVLAPHFFGDNSAKNRRIFGLTIAWVPSTIFAILCAAIANSTGNYLQPYRGTANPPPYESCWIHYDLAKYVVIIPVAIALFINVCIAIRLGIVVWKMSKSAENFKPSNLRDEGSASHAGKAFRAVILLLPILGVPWILGFLVNIDGAENIISSIHIIVNGMQGLMIFILYIILNQEMRSVLKRTWQTTVSIHSFSPTIHFVSTSTSTTQTSKRDESQTELNMTRQEDREK